ncbi:MAG: flagellar assembly protein FliW [Candidatus Hydrogenedentes bacterium]|nr:flagellar assembly protein FliW [Candidatus Hydrogenedentota bacterium]
MQLSTTRFGNVEVADDSVVTFTQPIIGFQEFRRFVLLPGPEDSAVVWLQSTESADLAFLLMNPKDVVPDYRAKLGQHELAELAVTSVDELDIYTILVVSDDVSKVRTNLKAPVLLNPKQRLGKQTVLERSDYPIQFFLAQARKAAASPEEVSNARTDA